MFRIARTTRRVTEYRSERVVCEPFTHLVLHKFDTEEAAKQSLIDGINAGVLAVKTRSLTPSASALRGAGEYEYSVLSGPASERKFYLRLVQEYEDYYNDEYSLNGRTDWHEGPFETRREAESAAVQWLDRWSGMGEKLDGYDWKANGDEYVEDPRTHDGSGFSIAIREYEVVS